MRYLPEQDVRVETGVTQFGEDWPGVFIRGDDAFAYSMCLEGAMASLDAADPMATTALRSLLKLLKESRV